MIETNIDKLEKAFIKYKLIENKIKNIKKNNELIDLNKEYSKLKKNLSIYIEYKEIINEIEKTKLLLNDKDVILQKLAQEDLELLEKKKDITEKKLFNKNHENKKENIFFEIRAATGGNESSIFAKDLFKMYINYFTNEKWKVNVLSISQNNINGYKEVIIKISGKNILEKIKYESGVHRVQRIPLTETNGRIHTSTCSIAILEELEDEEIDININDLRIDTYRASGAGGQHVNMTDSAVRITHIPTGIVAECQNERSQHKNKNTALKLLKTRIISLKKNNKKKNMDNERKILIGGGHRSEKIRTYNYIQNRITDHRTKITIHRLEDVLNGNLNLLINSFLKKNNEI